MAASVATADLSRNGGGGSGGRGSRTVGISRPQPSSWDANNNYNCSVDGMAVLSPAAAAPLSATAMASPDIAHTTNNSNHNNTVKQDLAAQDTMALRGLPASTEWETYKATIHELYMDRNLNLNEVVERMRVHDFHAT